MKRLIGIVLLAMVMFACRGGEVQKAAAVTEPAAEAPAVVAELALPEVPAMLQDVTSRANYVLTHFWDSLEFTDTLRSHNRDFMEQNFSNFISVFPLADDAARIAAVDTLMTRAEAEAGACSLVMEIAEKYLYELDSPMLSEDYYTIFLERFVASKVLDRFEKMRPLDQLDAVRKNRPGMVAADFAYTTREGKRTSLYRTDTGSADRLLLLFYDPDCEHCKEIIGNMLQDKRFDALVAGRQLAVLAVYSGEERDLWNATAASLPAEWSVGYEPGDMQEDGVYVLRAMPTMYLLDRNKRVILKDVSLEQVLSAFGNS